MTKLNRELTAEEIRVEENALMDFQFAIIDALNERNMTQAQFAEVLGVSRARVSQMLSSTANPTLKLVGRALALLGLKAAYPSSSEDCDEVCAEIEMDDIARRWFAHQHSRAFNVWQHNDAPVGANSNNNPEILEAA